MKLKLLFLLLITSIACTKNSKHEVLHVINANGYTILSDTLVRFSKMEVVNGKITYLGNDSSKFTSRSTQVYDANGKTILPGLIDAHAHVMGLGYNNLDVDVMGINSLDSTLKAIKYYSEQNPELEWIRGRGWNQTIWNENAFPTAQDLDNVISDKPVYLKRVDGHAAWANSEALKIAGISKETVDPNGGKILRDEFGNPTGVLIDKAMGLVTKVIPERTKVEKQKALQLAFEEMAEMGITGVHDAGIPVDVFELYKSEASKGNFKTRIYAMIGGAGTDFDEISKSGLVKNFADDVLYVQSVKLYMDGALGSRGAAMIHPYHDDPANTGLLFHDINELTKMMRKVASKGYQINTHAIGDKANRVTLDAIENVIKDLNLKDHRFRIEHAQIVHPDDIPRFKDLDVIASMQPTHATSDMNMAEDRVGSERIKGAYAWRTFLGQGTIVASGSDFPVEKSNPFHGLYSAVSRASHNGMPDGGWYPEQKLSRFEALKSFTVDAAWAGFMQDVSGSLAVGKWADFIVIDQDFFTCDESDIWKIDVLETFLAGKSVYSK